MKKIIDVSSKQEFEIWPTKSGENQLPCPRCADDHPKSAKRKCFSWNDQKDAGYCHRCDAHFVKSKPLEMKKEEFALPEFDDKTELTPEHLKWFHGRMISNEALKKGRVYSSTEFMPQLEKEVPVVCFPCYRDGQLVNVKYRGPKKSFKLTKGAEKIFYNWDLAKTSPTIIIVEGEIDALSYLTCGINFVISVPNGANKNLDYLDTCIEHFDQVESVILATDQDEKGLILRDELARRIGADKCRIADFQDCKDANEFLVKYGAPELFKTLEGARDYPIEGIFTSNDFKDEIYYLWKNGIQPGLKIGVPEIDDHITWETGRIGIFTGIPGHGKSEFLDFVLTKLNLYHGWKVGYFSPENTPLELHYAKVAEKIIGRSFKASSMTMDEYQTLFKYISKNYFFIAPENEYTVDSILTKARFLVRKYGIKAMVIDPYNRLEHQYDGKTETQYISEFLDKLTNFAKINKVLLLLVAHPYKMQREGKEMAIPNLYSISGSSNFYNKTDYGVTVYRRSDEKGLINQTEIYVQKVKFKHLGHTGRVELSYNWKNGRFEQGSPDGIDGWDNSNWLHKPDAPLTPNTSNKDVPF